MKFVAQSWLSYRQRVISANATQDQIDQLRLAFYSGFISMVEVTKRIGEPDISEKQGLDTLTAIQIEIDEFIKRHK